MPGTISLTVRPTTLATVATTVGALIGLLVGLLNSPRRRLRLNEQPCTSSASTPPSPHVPTDIPSRPEEAVVLPAVVGMVHTRNQMQHPMQGNTQRRLASPAEFDTIVPSMEDMVQRRERSQAAFFAMTPTDVLDELSRGNTRFWTQQSTHRELNVMERRAEIWQVFPKVAIIGCSDSRVPPEIIFDQGPGDVFVIRVAGNSYGTGVAGSVQYAVTHLHVKVVMVLGHEGCGVIRAAQLPLDTIEKEPEELRDWLKVVRRGLTGGNVITQISDIRARDREAVIKNVRHQVRVIEAKESISSRVATGDLLVVGAFYDKRSGMVDFIRCGDELDPAEVDMEPSVICSAEAEGMEEVVIDDGSAQVVVNSSQNYGETSAGETVRGIGNGNPQRNDELHR